MEIHRCANCYELRSFFICNRCKHVRYCSKPCQAQHWRVGGHRNICVAVSMSSISTADFDALLYATQLGDIASMKKIMLSKDPNSTNFNEVI
jgi:hypothetical protein